MNIKISVCNRKTDRFYKNKEVTWDYLKDRNRNPVRTTETVSEYPKLPKQRRDDAKDHGGFVGGFLKKGSRKNGNVINRTIGCLDADSIPPKVDFPFLVELALPDTEYFIYSTHSHSPTEPRFRLIVLFSREVSEDEYPAVLRQVAKSIGMDFFDDSTYQANRMMYWSSCSSNAEFVFAENAGSPLDPDVYLGMYEDWRDISQHPTSSRQSEVKAPRAASNAVKSNPTKSGFAVQEDPQSKGGVVGAFCRAYTIKEVISTFLPHVYRPSAVPGRYDYIAADSIAGVVIYDGRFAYSHHATDPACGKECNAFDLVRIHKFGDCDEKSSFKMMSEFAVKDSRVSALLHAERQAQASADFGSIDEAKVAEVEDPNAWIKKLSREKSGEIENTLRNIALIVENDPKLKALVFNQLADGMEIKGELGKVPWNNPARFWRDADDAQLICYIDLHYGYFSARNYDIAITKVTDDRSYHPIREYFESLPEWDGTPRVDSLLIDYLGADDNDYVRAVTRKTLCAAVMRVQFPGIKFDNIPVFNGPQGVGKSTLIAKLGGEWYSDSLNLSDMNDKTAAEKLQGYWILEIGELAGMKKADIDKVKAFISRQDDKYRASFGRRVTPHPRQCVFFGTTNSEKGYLRDVTGNRRFWTVKTPGTSIKKPWELTTEDVQQVWAEVLCHVKAGEKLYLNSELERLAKAEQSEAMEQDEREGLVRSYLETLVPRNWYSLEIWQRRNFINEPTDPTQPAGVCRRDVVCNI